MKAVHRGYEISVTREKSMGGELLLYYSIFRISDGFECTSGFTYDESAVHTYIGYMKERIDAELKEDDPWGENEDL